MIERLAIGACLYALLAAGAWSVGYLIGRYAFALLL